MTARELIEELSRHDASTTVFVEEPTNPGNHRWGISIRSVRYDDEMQAIMLSEEP